MTWFAAGHTYKIGAELELIQDIVRTSGEVVFSGGTAATSEPFTRANSFGAFSTGFGFASFLLGAYSSIAQNAFNEPREGPRNGRCMFKTPGR